MEGSTGLDPKKDVVLAEVDGELVAATGVERVVRAGQPTYEIWGNVAPDYRRRGLGSWLLPWTLARAAARTAVEDAGLEPTLASHTEETEAGHRALLEGAGFTVIRHFFLMKRELSEPIPEAPLPEGIELRPVTPDQHRAIFDAEREAFRDHWNSRELGRRRLCQHVRPRGARHPSLGRRLGRRRGRGRRPELDLGLGERGPGRLAWMARAHQRPPAVASARPGPGDHRGIAAHLPGEGACPGHARCRFGEPDRRPRTLRGSRLRGHAALVRVPAVDLGRRRAGSQTADGQAKSLPPSRTSSIQARSRPTVVVGRGPGRPDVVLQPGEPGDRGRPSPPGRRRAGPPCPSRRRTACRRCTGDPRPSARRQTDPSVWPGVWSTRSRIEPKRTTPPSASSTAGTEAGCRTARTAVAGVEPVAVERMDRDLGAGRSATAALSPMWSQWPWVETMSLSVQSRSASEPAIQASDGVAVSIAIASRRPRVGQDVHVRRDRPDDAAEVFDGRQASSFARMQSKVWPIILLAVPSISRAPTLASVPDRLTSAVQSMTSCPARRHRRGASRRRVDRAAGRLTVGVDDRLVRRVQLGECHAPR